MKKRGQISVFILLAIVIIIFVIAVSITFYSSKKDVAYFESSSVKVRLDAVHSSIFNCEEVSAQNALDTIGIQGGYYHKPKEGRIESLEEGAFIPYYYHEGRFFIPTKEAMEKELATAYTDYLNDCIVTHSDSEFSIKTSSPHTAVYIRENSVVFTTETNVRIEREGHTTYLELEQYPLEIPSALYDMYDLAYYITESHRQDAAMYCIDCVADRAEEKNLYVDMIPVNDLTSLLIISENYTRSEPYSFMFLNKYLGTEVSPELNVEDTTHVPEIA